jgi:hypothetical protein
MGCDSNFLKGKKTTDYGEDFAQYATRGLDEEGVMHIKRIQISDTAKPPVFAAACGRQWGKGRQNSIGLLLPQVPFTSHMQCDFFEIDTSSGIGNRESGNRTDMRMGKILPAIAITGSCMIGYRRRDFLTAGLPSPASFACVVRADAWRSPDARGRGEGSGESKKKKKPHRADPTSTRVDRSHVNQS